MGFLSSIQGLWTFDQTIEEESSSKDFSVITSNPSYDTFQIFDFFSSKLSSRYGLAFKEDISFESTGNISLVADGHYNGLIAFWWSSPIALGVTRHTITRKSTSYVSPIIAKATSSINDGFEQISSGEWIISEIGVSDTHNAIQFLLCSTNGNPTHRIVSESYLPGLHHVAITIEKASSGRKLLRLDIDGKPGAIHVGPTNMSGTSDNILINSVGYGYTAHKALQTGILGDLVIKSGTTTGNVISMIRFGWQTIAKSEYNGANWFFNAFSFSRPSTVSTNQIYVDGGNIYTARSDGELLKGCRPIWDIEYTYANPSSISFLNLTNVDDCPPAENKRTVCWSENGLRIEATTIKI